MTDQLCSACHHIFSNQRVKLVALGFEDRYEHHNPPYLLEAASKQGCYICSRIWKQLSQAERKRVQSTHLWTNWLLRQKWFKVNQRLPGGAYSWTLQARSTRVAFVFGSGLKGWKTVSFDLIPADDPIEYRWQTAGHLNRTAPGQARPLREYVNSINLANSTESDKTWETIEGWWRASLQGKERSYDCVQFPTRLLDLQSSSTHGDLRLSVATLDRRSGPYMTLSYRWRNDNEPPREYAWQLRHDSLDAMRSRIVFADLPKTYQDAIVVTRKLGIRYLWIDGMCILQKDRADWKAESRTMDQIYKQAICNIAAGVGNMSEGLFVRRDPVAVMPLEVYADWFGFGSEWRRYDMGYGYVHGPQYLIEHSYPERCLYQASLNSRAWVVQERFLSKRILHFSPNQVFWEEYYSNACELFPMGCPYPWSSDGYEIEFEYGPMNGSRIDAKTLNEVIRHYSATSLTEPADKMVALAGVAQQWRNYMLEDEYCAGLWKSEFPHCLLWKVLDGTTHYGELCSTSPDFQTPSWSWLSVNGKVKPYTLDELFRRRDTRAQVLAFNLRPKSAGFELGPLEAGSHIIMRGRLKTAERIYWPMSRLFSDSNEPDCSIIWARTSPFSRPTDCSIDDMRSFLARWNNSLPSERSSINEIRWLFYRLAPYAFFLGFFATFIASLGWLTWLGTLAGWVGILARKSVWHFTNFGSSGLCFLEICHFNEDTEYSMVEGLLVQRRSDGAFDRLGTFTAKGKHLFAHIPYTEITLV